MAVNMNGCCSWLNILLFLSICNFSVSVVLPDDWKDYIKEITGKFEKGLIGKDFRIIIPPRCPITEAPNPSRFTFPNLYIWDPLSQYEDIFLRFPFTCPCHKDIRLKPKQWTDGTTNALYPRVILDNQGPSLLITRNYYCDSGRHYVRGTHGDLMVTIGQVVHRPFKLTHKYAFTLSFVQRLRDFVSNGISFNYLQANYMEWQLQDFIDRKERFDWHKTLWERTRTSDQEDSTTQEYSETFWNSYKQKMITLCPSDDLLCDIFLKDFEDRKYLYEDAMRSTTATGLMADHTFKVAVNIGVKRTADGAWVKQFNSLFVVLNEKHEVVTWKLTKKEQFDVIKSVLEQLRDRPYLNMVDVKFFIIDNCCTWRKKIQEVFGEDTRVLLDLFHATQRLTKTIVKSHSFQANCKHDCGMLFRCDDDKGVQRLKATPTKEILLANLDRFADKWKHISETSPEEPLFRESFDKEVVNLRKHIILGCLSDIPPGYSTSINESLHQKINELFAGAKMGPELAVALLTVFFYAWNSRRRNKINGISIVEPLSSSPLCGSTVNIQPKETFGIGSNFNIDNSKVQEHNDEQYQNSNNGIFKRAMSMLRLHNFIKTSSNNGSELRWQDIFFHNEILGYIFGGSGKETEQEQNSEDTTEKTKAKVDYVAARFGMQVVPMSKDGNCLFNAVAFSVSQRFSKSKGLNNASHHYVELGIQPFSTVDVISQSLRNIMTNELKTNKTKYLPFLQNVDEEQYDNLVDTFRQPGVFSGDMGDLMVKALANVLKTPLILLTNITNYHVITVTPDEFNDTSDNIFITFTRDGPGHYDALTEVSTDVNDQTKIKDCNEETKCTCGMTRKEIKETCMNGKTRNGRTYSSRCPCLRNEQGCRDSCRCKGCQNPLGKHINECAEGQRAQKSRRRAKTDTSGERKDGSTYMKNEKEEIAYGKWTDEENFIFLQHVIMNPELLTEDDYDVVLEQLTKSFNASVLDAEKVFGNGHANPKTKKQIKNKLENIKKKKELAYRLLEDQLQQFLAQLHE